MQTSRKIVSAPRSAQVRSTPRSASQLKVSSSGCFSAPSWAPSKLVVPIEAITTAAEPGTAAQRVAAASGRLTPSLPSRASKAPSWENIPK